jgi:SAM-dependent methyltransferase
VDLDELLATGVREIDRMLAWLDELGVTYRTGRALDFGCGAGATTQALARTFARCDGVDDAASEIERAREINRFGERVHYRVNDRDDLTSFDDGAFDLVYSGGTLAWRPPEESAPYVYEFTRVLAPGGVAVFEVPSHPLAGDEPAGDAAARTVTDTHGIRRANVETILLAGTVDLVVAQETDRVAGWCDYRYVGIKREPPATKPRRRWRDRLRQR